MTAYPSAPRRPSRARRLHHEAGNCIAIAVREPDRAFAATLIDEALRLSARARELADPD